MIGRIIILLCLIQFSYSGIWAQSTFFNRTYDIEQWDVATAALQIGGGYMVLGQAITTEARMMMLVKLDFNGDTLWTKVYNSPPQVYFTGGGKSFIKTIDGGYAFCGTVVDSADSGLDDMVLVKFDSIGDTLWTKRYGGSAQDLGQDCEQTADGGYILIGTTGSYSDPSGDVYLVKTDSLGNVEWDTTYGGMGNLDAGFSVNTTNDGGYVLGASLSQSGEFIWIIKTDSVGGVEWTKSINVNLNRGCFVLQAIDGGYIIIAGKDDLTGNGKDGYLAKLNSTGDSILWKRTFVGSSQNDWFNQAIELSDGSIVAAGQADNEQNISSGWLLKVAPNGDSLWSRKFSVPDSLSQQFWSLRTTQDGGFVMSGYAAAPAQDTWVVKTNCLGFEDLPQAVYSFTTDTLTVSFLNQSERGGTYLWNFGDGNVSTDINPSHTYQDSGAYIVNLTAAACGDTSAFVDTVAVSIPIGIHLQLPDNNVQLFLAPNPFKESTTITYSLPFSTEHGEIVIYNTVGHVVAKYKVIGSGQIEFSNSNLSPGIYACSYTHGGELIKSLKMVLIK